MHRAIIWFGLLLLGLAAATTSALASDPAQDTVGGAVRPNIIIILTDDQRWETVTLMPNVQSRIAGHGYSFRKAFVTTPLCCPSRASFLSGQYALNHDVWTNYAPLGGATRFNDSTTVATLLQDAGYRTALLGKYLNDYDTLMDQYGYPYVPPGWDDWFAFVDNVGSGDGYYYNYSANNNGVMEAYGEEPADYSTDLLTNMAVDIIDSTTDQPFFIYLSYWAPHTIPVPADRHLGQFSNWTPSTRPNFNEADVSDKPLHVSELPPVNQQESLILVRRQMETLLAVDEGVGAILDALEQTGALNNTFVFFVSDNGFLYGEHRWLGKSVPYEESIRVPLMLRVPSVTTPQVRQELVLNIDITPTVLDLARVNVPPPVQDALDGRSLRFINSPGWRDDFVIEKLAADDESRVFTYIGVRSADWKYILYGSGETELYDLTADPYELVNRSGDPAYAVIEAELADRLAELRPDWPYSRGR